MEFVFHLGVVLWSNVSFLIFLRCCFHVQKQFRYEWCVFVVSQPMVGTSSVERMELKKTIR